MTIRRPRRASLVALAVSLSLAACSGGGTAPATTGSAPAAGVSITVFAAASLRGAFSAVQAAYEASHPGVRLTFSFDASSTLETQIEQGAPADVFASADMANPQKLVDHGLTVGPVTPFAGNRLAVIVPPANPAGIGSPVDLARPGVKIVAAGDAVPITKYATRLIGNLAGLPGYPAGYAAAVGANVISREDNVAAVVSKIELGEGDAAIVYATDAAGSTTVRPVAVPDAANVTATYGAVVPKASGVAAQAAAFVAWLAGPQGQAVLHRFGFSAPS